MRSILIFVSLQAMSFALGSSDALTIAIVVLAVAILIFGSAFISASLKDRLQKKKFTKTVFGS